MAVRMAIKSCLLQLHPLDAHPAAALKTSVPTMCQDKLLPASCSTPHHAAGPWCPWGLRYRLPTAAQHSSGDSSPSSCRQRCWGGHHSTAVTNKSLHSIWMLLPPCCPSVRDSKDGEVEDPPPSDAVCENSPLPHAINAAVVNSTASATAATTDLPSFTASLDQTFWFFPAPLLKARSGITPPHLLSQAAWPGHCLQAGCALSRWDVLPLQTHWAGLSHCFSSGCSFNHHQCSSSPCKCSTFR